MSLIQSKSECRANDYFCDFIGCEEGTMAQAHLHKVAANLTFAPATNQSALKLAQVSVNSTRGN
ncbi:hypothetical protein [Pseudomonas sp. P5_152]|uniref:hypothetical protein n=1 Tax=Pseudomonas sp. P5_152 TaxID=3043442 RepID=UPI0039B76260